MARGRGRGRGRPVGRPRKASAPAAEESMDDSAIVDENEQNDVSIAEGEADVNNSEVNNDEDADESKVKEEPKTPKKRGRKRKSDLIAQAEPEVETPASEPSTRGSLRRRDTLRTASRYSPPPVSTRMRGTNRSFTSTNQNKSIADDSDKESSNISTPKAENVPPSVNRRKSLGIRTSSASNSTVNNVEKPEESSKSADDKATPLPAEPGVKTLASKRSSITEDSVTEAAKPTVAEPQFKSSPRTYRRKSDITSQAQANNISAGTVNTVSELVTMESKTLKVSNLTTVKLTNHTSTPLATVTKSVSHSVTQLKQGIITPIPKSLPAILKTPQQINSVANATLQLKNTPNARRLLPLAKYVGDGLPEVAECLNSDEIDDSKMEKLPDKILLINSELPLKLAVSIDHSDSKFLFRQIISPVNSTRFVCLLCKGIDVNFGTKEEKDILLHYQSLHELDVEIGHAKFSEDIVFICLPKMVLNQLNSSASLQLNSTCQYCDARLNDIEEMKSHYLADHQKEVVLMEQEQIMKMHHYFYCCECKAESPDFDTHHKHMKVEHNLKTYKCKSCVLVTQDENRLRTHFKAKHMLHTQGQNYQCFYCHGLLIGVERLLKHIQQSHMVQTGIDYSCVSCLQPCGRGKELLTHAQSCQLAGIKPEQKDLKFGPLPLNAEPLAEGEVECYFCNVRLESDEIYKLHLLHEHMKWVGEPQKTPPSADVKLLTIDEVISDEDLKKAKIETYVGHWCKSCDQMVKVYQLYYMHMINFHRMEKEFQCIISSCKQQFKEFDEFKKHIEEAGHQQKTIISHPDEVFVCSYCDVYFPTEDELIDHLITDQHINKFTASGHFHRTEPRNFKCKACHTFFGMKESYIHHLETEAHKYSCIYCGITTATASARRAHVQNTHSDKLSLCEECQTATGDILAHFVEHGFTFECKKCVKKFYNRERLNAHMEVHQDPIECTWDNCGRMIATRSMLVTHYRGHKSEHKCQICGQAFWNFSMLTSHLRSHQPLPRSSHQPVKSNQAKSSMTYANFSRNSPGVLQRRGANTPIANNVIKCGHCSNLFKSTKDLTSHICRKTTAPGVGTKLMELASKAEQAKFGKSTPHQTTPRRRASPKKPATTVDSQIDLSKLSGPSGESQPADEDTQTIMVLNQLTGVLMEITAPKGMEVQDVIDSLDLEEVVGNPADASMESHIVVQNKNGEPEDEAAAAIEMLEQQQTNEAGSVVTGQEDQNATAVDGSEQMIIEQQYEAKEGGEENQIAHIIQDQEGGQEIVLPADCFNADGSLNIDAETLNRLNLTIGVDENGQQVYTTSDTNTTFVIESSTAE